MVVIYVTVLVPISSLSFSKEDLRQLVRSKFLKVHGAVRDTSHLWNACSALCLSTGLCALGEGWWGKSASKATVGLHGVGKDDPRLRARPLGKHFHTSHHLILSQPVRVRDPSIPVGFARGRRANGRTHTWVCPDLASLPATHRGD